MNSVTEPALDAEVIDRLRRWGDEGHEDLVGQLAELFLPDAASHIDALRRALASDDAVAVSQIAHTLGGASANIGAAGLARACVPLATPGTSGVAGNPVGAGLLLDTIEAELTRVRLALDRLTAP